ncbi:hypothetical protein CDAR_183711 [Caerostris darwini]|uniref:Uncharacterized protein n=1 Tax=Caerostris darwini TaxID=1538125 RepID=A0AAV4PZG7_9ARAC|nr:hypothetical protein CDAR_183711 [Caerostris darwini]
MHFQLFTFTSLSFEGIPMHLVIVHTRIFEGAFPCTSNVYAFTFPHRFEGVPIHFSSFIQKYFHALRRCSHPFLLDHSKVFQCTSAVFTTIFPQKEFHVFEVVHMKVPELLTT